MVYTDSTQYTFYEVRNGNKNLMCKSNNLKGALVHMLSVNSLNIETKGLLERCLKDMHNEADCIRLYNIFNYYVNKGSNRVGKIWICFRNSDCIFSDLNR